ncbi:MAG TPA: ABC transporter permease [Pseudonocardiaceae bacterium]|jgi:ABC-type nitrate/sulfonate/bicarbonate transport system permease component|nr:ABC transporter permease [Pseudonocardiaceae bacterium]
MAVLRSTTIRRPLPQRRFVRPVIGWAGVLVVALGWQLLAVALNTSIFPTFITTMQAVGTVLSGPALSQDVLPSVERALAGFAISAVLGVVVGLALGYYRRLGDYCATLVDFLRSLPTPLFVPLAIVLLGLGSQMVVAIVVSAAVWPVLLNAFDAARRVEPLHLDTARALGLRGVALFRRVLFPATLPSIVAGLRIALSTSLAVLIIAEILGASSGLGYFIQDAQQTFEVPETYAGVVILAALGWLFDTLFLAAEHRWLRWDQATAGGNRV